MSKATNRKIRRQLERKAVQRQQATLQTARDKAQKARELGLRVASTGDMLREVGRR